MRTRRRWRRRGSTPWRGARSRSGPTGRWRAFLFKQLAAKVQRLALLLGALLLARRQAQLDLRVVHLPLQHLDLLLQLRVHLLVAILLRALQHVLQASQPLQLRLQLQLQLRSALLLEPVVRERFRVLGPADCDAVSDAFVADLEQAGAGAEADGRAALELLDIVTLRNQVNHRRLLLLLRRRLLVVAAQQLEDLLGRLGLLPLDFDAIGDAAAGVLLDDLCGEAVVCVSREVLADDHDGLFLALHELLDDVVGAVLQAVEHRLVEAGGRRLGRKGEADEAAVGLEGVEEGRVLDVLQALVEGLLEEDRLVGVEAVQVHQAQGVRAVVVQVALRH
mmetsp:Transcript_20260/g.77568  ORF Transcript_20260/g.77568 Transcript_20260/m.77568 type:complete len:335 (-) Transcript_20260:449-1453(-)